MLVTSAPILCLGMLIVSGVVDCTRLFRAGREEGVCQIYAILMKCLDLVTINALVIGKHIQPRHAKFADMTHLR